MAGDETANHTVHHYNGGPISLRGGAQNKNFSVPRWTSEITRCSHALLAIGAQASDIIGFRSPYLGYNDDLYTTLERLKFAYDTTIPNCFDVDEDGTNCAWPYTLDRGSPDQVVLSRRFTKTYNGVAFSTCRRSAAIPAVSGNASDNDDNSTRQRGCSIQFYGRIVQANPSQYGPRSGFSRYLGYVESADVQNGRTRLRPAQ